jgi:hypothetical protein
MFANHEYPKQKIPLINIPPIVYSNQSREQTSNQKTNDIPSSSSFDTFMKSLRSTLVAPSVDKPKVSFVKNNQGELMAVPYDSAKDAGFVEITGKPGKEASRFYARTTKNAMGKSDDDSDDDDDDDKDKREKKPVTKDTDDYIFHLYVGSLSVIGLLILFRIIQKS